MAFHDFEKIKQDHPIEDVAAALKLAMKASNNQLRGPCPACQKGGDRALVITPAKKVFYCFAAGKGGDVLALVSHILDKPVKQAAEWLCGGTGAVQDTSTSTASPTPPESESGKQGGRTLAPLTYLQHDHEAVIAVGFDVDFAKTHGVGYAGKGVARGNVLIPFRDESGTLLGYVGVQEAWLPTDFKTNVVPFNKKSA